MTFETEKKYPELDELDRRIIAVLQHDAALTNNELALRVHASPPTCLRRVRRLRDSGVIARQVALVQAQALGPTLSAIVEISLDHQGAEHLQEFEARVAGETAVQQCYRVSPGPDFILIVQIRDMAAYHDLAHRLFAANANVRNVRSYFVTHTAKFETSMVV